MSCRGSEILFDSCNQTRRGGSDPGLPLAASTVMSLRLGFETPGFEVRGTKGVILRCNGQNRYVQKAKGKETWASPEKPLATPRGSNMPTPGSTRLLAGLERVRADLAVLGLAAFYSSLSLSCQGLVTCLQSHLSREGTLGASHNLRPSRPYYGIQTTVQLQETERVLSSLYAE